jgi:hypothetical protein
LGEGLIPLDNITKYCRPKGHDLGAVLVNCMECHVVLKVNLVAKVVSDLAATVPFSIGLHEGGGGGVKRLSQLLAELLLASLSIISKVKER